MKNLIIDTILSDINDKISSGIGFFCKNLEDEKRLINANTYKIISSFYNSNTILKFLMVEILNFDDLYSLENLAKNNNAIARVMLNFGDENELKKAFLYTRNSKFLNTIGLNLKDKKFSAEEILRSFKSLNSDLLFVETNEALNVDVTFIKRIE